MKFTFQIILISVSAWFFLFALGAITHELINAFHRGWQFTTHTQSTPQ